MDNSTKNNILVQKMAKGMKIAFFLSLATAFFDVYRFMTEPGNFRKGIGIALGIVGTLLLWQVGRELSAEKKQALYYWLGLGLVAYTRWIFVEATFQWNMASFIVILVLFVLSLQMMILIRSKSLS